MNTEYLLNVEQPGRAYLRVQLDPLATIVDALESLAAEALSAANALRVPGGVA
jgi:hypothetical protein